MKRERVAVVGGGTVELIVPENAEDVAELIRQEREGRLVLDDRLSLGDGHPDTESGGLARNPLPPKPRRRSARQRKRQR